MPNDFVTIEYRRDVSRTFSHTFFFACTNVNPLSTLILKEWKKLYQLIIRELPNPSPKVLFGQQNIEAKYLNRHKLLRKVRQSSLIYHCFSGDVRAYTCRLGSDRETNAC
jgi:hypothetical protein